MIFQVNIVAFAAQTPTVSSDDIVLTQSETLIPVKIKNNSGLMGYRITVKYDKTKIDVCSVTKGDVSGKGNFVTNFSTDSDTFDVLWNNTDNVAKNGNLFVLSAKAKNGASGKTEIKLSFSQPDTFDVTYTDVPLNCKNINVTLKKDEQITDSSSSAATKTNRDNSYVANDSQILDAVNALLRKEGKSSLDEIDNKEDFLKELNENLNIITSSDKNNITDFDFLKQLYKLSYQNTFIKEVEDNIESDTVNKIINDSLKEYGVNDIKDLKDKDKKSFVGTVQSKLQESDSDVPNIADDLSNDDAVETIEKLENKKKIKEKNNKEDNSKKIDMKTIIIIVSVFCLLFILFLVLFIKRRKSKMNV